MGETIYIAQKVNGVYPDNSLALIFCKEGYDTPYHLIICTNGTWLPTPHCIGSNNISLQNWEEQKN